MLAAAVQIISLIWARIANILRNSAHDEVDVDTWIRQQTRVREAIAQAKSTNAQARPTGVEGEWLEPWVRQQARLRQAIVLAKSNNMPGKLADSADEWVDPWIRQQARVRTAIAQAKRENLVAQRRRFE